MRLIDADKLMQDLADEMLAKALDMLNYDDVEYMIDRLASIPTAFDIDKVVEQLDKQINKCNAELTPDCDTVKMFSLCGRRQAFIEAISIIKR